MMLKKLKLFFNAVVFVTGTRGAGQGKKSSSSYEIIVIRFLADITFFY